jgi:surfeit locus 1 family protein
VTAVADTMRVFRSPRWIVGLVVAVVTVVIFVTLGLWQLGRLDERRATNAAIVASTAHDPIDLEVFVAGGGDPADLVWRRVSVAGEYAPEAEVILSSRSHKAQPGHNVLTPLLLTDGAALIVNRGWIPFELGDPPVGGATPPSGRVTVTGTLRADEGAGLLGGGGDGEPVRRIASIDLARLGADQEVGTAYPVYLQLADQDPAGGALPEPVPLPLPSEGSHLSYAVQWFLFAGIVLIGFPVLVWRTARSERGSAP